MTAYIDIEHLKKENDSLKIELLANKIASDLGTLKTFVEDKVKIQKELELLKLKIESKDDFDVSIGSDEENNRFKLIIENLENKNKDLSKENLRLLADKKSYIKERKELYTSIGKSNDQTDLLKNENSHLYEQVESYRQSSDENEEALNFYMDNNKQLKQEIDSLKSTDYEKLYKDEIDDLKSDIKSYEFKVSVKTSTIENLNEELTIADNTIKKQNTILSQKETLIKDLSSNKTNSMTSDLNDNRQPDEAKVNLEKLSKLPALNSLIDLNGFLIAKLEEESRTKLLGYKYNDITPIGLEDITENLEDKTILEKTKEENHLEKEALIQNTEISSKEKNLDLKEEEALLEVNNQKEEIPKENLQTPKVDEFIEDPLKAFGDIFTIEDNPERIETSENINSTEDEVLIAKKSSEIDSKVDNFFKNMSYSKTYLKTSSGSNILPLEEIMSEPELEIYAVELQNSLEFRGNLSKIDEKEFFRFLVGYAFFNYEDGELWEPLFNFIGIRQNNRYQQTMTEKIKATADMYDYVFYVNSAGNRAFVETIKMHTIIPLNYIQNILPQLHTLYRRELKGTANEEVFKRVVMDKFDNEEFHSIKTLHHLWEMEKKEEVTSYLYELTLALDALDKGKELQNTFLRKDVLSEVKDWFENSLERLYISKGSLAEYFGRSDLKDPSFTLNYRNREVTLREFSLPNDILKVKIRISYEDGKAPIERKVEYYRSNDLYKTKEVTLTLESEVMIFGKYEVVIDTDIEKEVSIYTEEKSYILLNDKYIQIKNIDSYSGNNFYVQYLSNYYEVISSDEITIEKVGKITERVLLNKNSINYLRDLHRKKVTKRLSIIESKEVNFAFKRLENIKVDKLPVYSTHPYPEGFNKIDHILYINNSRVDETPKDVNGRYTMAIKDRRKNKLLKHIEYYLLPNTKVDFSAIYEDGAKKPIEKSYVFSQPAEMSILINSEVIDEISSSDERIDENIIKGKNEFDILINDDVTDEYFEREFLTFDFNINGETIAFEYIIPKLKWELGDQSYSAPGGSIWKERLINNRFRVLRGGKSVLVDLSLEDFQDEITEDLNFDNFIHKLLRLHGIKENVFDVTSEPIILHGDKLLVYTPKEDTVLKIINDNTKKIENLVTKVGPTEYDISDLFGEIKVEIVEKSLWGDEDILYSSSFAKDYVFEVGEVFNIKTMYLLNKNKDIETTLELDEDIRLKYVGGLGDYHYGEVLNTSLVKFDEPTFRTLENGYVHFRFDMKNFTIKKLKLKDKNGNFLPLKYALNRKSQLEKLYHYKENLKRWEKDNQLFSFKLGKES